MADRAEDMGRLLMSAEKQGARLGMRCTISGHHAQISGSPKWQAAFLRGYRRGEVSAWLQPWHTLASRSTQ